MKRTETLIKELIGIEKELRKRNPKDVCKAIEKVEKETNVSTTCLSCFYQGCRDMLYEAKDDNLIDLYEEERL